MNDFEGFIESIKREDIDEVKRLFREEFINKRSAGFTPLHLASQCNYKCEIVEYLLSKGCNIEDEHNLDRFRCIHYAVMFDKVEVLKSLIKAGCNLDSVDKNKSTAFHLAGVTKKHECAHILNKAKIDQKVKEDLELLEKNSLSKIMDPKTGKTLLDELLSNNDPRILEAIKVIPVDDKEIKEFQAMESRGVDPDSYHLLHECMLSRCILHKYYEGIEDLCTPEMVNKSSLFMGLSTLETAVDCDLKTYYVKDILWKLEKEDESWIKAENISKTRNNQKVTTLISKRREYLKSEEKRGFSRLHVASMENDADMIQYMLNHPRISVDEDLKKGGSALSLAYNLGHSECVETLQKNKVEVNVFDKFKQLPLHAAIQSRTEEFCEYLVETTKDIEARDFMGFTVLERSVMNDCENICERLVRKGARCDRFVQFDLRGLDIDKDLGLILCKTPNSPLTDSETIYTLCFKVNKAVYPGLFETIDESTVDLADGRGNSLLHLGAASLQYGFCSALISKKANVNLENEGKRTPLFELLIQNYNESENEVTEDMLETIKVLTREGASLDGKDINGRTIFDTATDYGNEKLLLALIRTEESLKYLEEPLWLAWLDNKYYTFLKEVIPLIQDSLVSRWIRKESIKICLEDKETMLAKAMYDKALPGVQMEVVERLLYQASLVGDRTLFEEMIKNDIPPRMSSDEEEEEEESLMNYVIKDRNEEFILIVLYSKHGNMYLEREGARRKLPLHVCIECEYWEIIEKLIDFTKSVNNEDDEGNTALSLLLTKMSETEDSQSIDKLMDCVKKLILKSADIYKVNKLYKSNISYCTKSDLKEKIEYLFQNNQPKTAPSSKPVVYWSEYGATNSLTTYSSEEIWVSTNPQNVDTGDFEINSAEIREVVESDLPFTSSFLPVPE